MANFNEAISVLFEKEGFYSDDKKDNGGKTKYGISKKSYPNLDIENLTIQDATDIYMVDFWNKHRLSEIKSQQIALKLFLFIVNMNPRDPIKRIQRSLRAVDNAFVVKCDGLIGSVTIEHINKACGISCGSFGLECAFEAHMSNYYRRLEFSKKLKEGAFCRFIKGWLNRVYK